MILLRGRKIKLSKIPQKQRSTQQVIELKINPAIYENSNDYTTEKYLIDLGDRRRMIGQQTTRKTSQKSESQQDCDSLFILFPTVGSSLSSVVHFSVVCFSVVPSPNADTQYN